MSNSQPITTHLAKTQWKPGQSGNPNGKPKGTVHISTHISNLLEDEDFTCRLRDGRVFKGAPVKAIVTVAIIRALNGDLKAFELLVRAGYRDKDLYHSQHNPIPILSNINLESEK